MKFKDDIILITGSNGRIGTAVMQRLRARFDNVVGFDLHAPEPPPPDCVRIAVDISSEDSVHDGLRILREHHGDRIAVVVHLAAYYDFMGKPSDKYDTITVAGTHRLLQGLRADFQVEQFVFSSTMLVHQPGEPGQFITEDWPLGPTWAYPQSKVRTEALIQAERGEIAAVLLRFAGVYDDHCHSPPLAHQMQRIYERQLNSHLYSGATSHGQSYVHLEDVVNAIERAVDRRAQLPPDVAILIGEPETLSYDELQHTFLRLIHNESWETYNVPGPIAKVGAWLENQMPGDDQFIQPWMIDRANDHYALDISRATSLLDWVPSHSLRKTLPKMVAELQADPLKWYRENRLEPPASLAEKSANSSHDQPHAAPAPAPALAHVHAMHSEQGASDHDDMRVADHRKMLWPHYVNLMLGIWLLSSPFTLGYLSQHVPDANGLRVMAERGLPSFEIRNLAMMWSDIVSGVLLMIFSALSASPARRYPWAQWANATVGFWLLFAPLVFWTPLPEAYANDTLVGALVIAFAVLIPMMPGMSMAGMMDESDVPPGWAYTPASWLQRMPIAVLGLFGFFIARYMTAYQLGYIDRAWDPFFGTGTMTIITSDMSKAWPIADAGLGAVAYMLEVLMTFMGGRNRWRTMPWMILMLGILMVPLGGVSVFFIIIQPMLIGTWCTLCLIAGLAMVIMIPYSLDEFVAMGQFLVDAQQQGKPMWRTFWMGDAMEGGSKDASKSLLGTPAEMLAESTRGVNFPITLVLATLIGVWLMFTRLTFDSSGAMANSDYLVGASVVTFSIIAFAEVARSVRFINVLFGLWLIIAPWLLTGVPSSLALFDSVICGLLLIALSIPRGTIRESYANWDRYVI